MPPKKKTSEADEAINAPLGDEDFGDEEEKEKEQQKKELFGEGEGAQKELNLEKLVSLPTWREMILDLVESEKLDPWNIDMAEITDKYIQRVRKMQILDLRVPANLILAAAILLKFKSDALKFEEEEQVAEDNVFIDEGAAGEGVEDVPVLELRTRIPPKTKLTLEELMTAMDEVFEDQKKRETKLLEAAPSTGSPLQINVPKYDMEDRMKEMLSRIEQNTDSEGLVLFSSLLTEKTAEQLILTLLPLLHLAQNNKISLKQEKMFGEIIIRLLSQKNDDINGIETEEPAKAG